MSNEDARAKARETIRNLPGISEDEMIALGPCAVCGKPLLDPETGGVTFYRVRVEHCGLDAEAVRRRAGLTMQMGGHDSIAWVFSPDRHLARVVSAGEPCAVHEGCAGRIAHLLTLMADEAGE